MPKTLAEKKEIAEKAKATRAANRAKKDKDEADKAKADKDKTVADGGGQQPDAIQDLLKSTAPDDGASKDGSDNGGGNKGNDNNDKTKSNTPAIDDASKTKSNTPVVDDASRTKSTPTAIDGEKKVDTGARRGSTQNDAHERYRRALADHQATQRTASAAEIAVEAVERVSGGRTLIRLLRDVKAAIYKNLGIEIFDDGTLAIQGKGCRVFAEFIGSMDYKLQNSTLGPSIRHRATELRNRFRAAWDDLTDQCRGARDAAEPVIIITCDKIEMWMEAAAVYALFHGIVNCRYGEMLVALGTDESTLLTTPDETLKAMASQGTQSGPGSLMTFVCYQLAASKFPTMRDDPAGPAGLMATSSHAEALVFAPFAQAPAPQAATMTAQVPMGLASLAAQNSLAGAPPTQMAIDHAALAAAVSTYMSEYGGDRGGWGGRRGGDRGGRGRGGNRLEPNQCRICRKMGHRSDTCPNK